MTRLGKKRQKKGEEKPVVAEGTRVRISKILEDFRAMNTDVYVFDENLTNRERAVVHELCRKMGMTSKSSGRGSQRRVSVYKSKKKTEKKTGKESLTSFTFSEVARDAVQDLFSHYPPSEGEVHEEMDGKHSGKADKINLKKDDIFFKPLMSKTDIIKRLESLASKIDREPKLRQISVERSKLPIASFRDIITSTIEAHQVVLISGETGCGKTTQVPQYILDSMWAKGEACKIICTQPRRISATSVSERISFERGENVGHDVGYKIRLESKGGRHSSVVFCTNGILLRVLISKGAGRKNREATNKHEKVDLSHITHIIVDEIHERDRYSDFMLAIVRDMLPSCPHLRLILMSATLDAERFSHYFGGCPIIRVPGFTYPVKTFYLEDVLSILKSANNNHLDSASDFQIDNRDLTEEYKVALDEAITLAWSNDELDPLLDLVSSEGTPKMFNYCHSSTGLTPLMVFAGKGRVADVCKLLSCGVDCSLRDNDGLTAFELAEKENQGETAEIIKKHMESVDSNSLEEQQLLDMYLAAINPEQVDIVLIEQLLRKICADSEDGAILIFFPGWDDINKTRERLLAAPYFRDFSKFWILSLHSMVPSAEQKKVFKRAPPGCRKIILSTNIAETAVTIGDVVYVIDSGRMKEKSYDPYDNVSTLQSSWISKASAKQREGRAGRCQPGICYHLYSKFRASSLPEFQVPEIKRMPIEELCLQVKLMDPNCKIEAFLRKTLDPPIFETIHNGIIVLQDIGALSRDEKLTELGEKLGILPVHPLISKMLFLAILLNCLDPALTLACAADSRNPFTLPMLPNDRKRADAAKLELASLYGGNSDQLAVIAAFECWKSAKETRQEAQFCSQCFVSSTTMHMLSGLRKQLQNELLRNGFIPNDVSSCNINARDPGILHAVLVAGLYPMVGRFLPPLKNRKRSSMIETAGSNKVRLHPHSINFKWTFKNYDGCPLIMYDEITRGDGGMHIRNCSIVGPLPLLLFATELAVAPLNGNDYEEDEEEDDSDEADEDEDDEMVEDGKGLNKSSKQPQERIMSSPDNTVMVIIDRWLPFELTALDVAQIYCLRERLSAAILFKVTNPRRVLPAVLGASVYAVSSILSYDGLSGISSLGSVPSVPSVSDLTGLEESAPDKRSAINKENNLLKSLMNRTSRQYTHKNSSETSSQFSNGAVYFDGCLSNRPSTPYQAASSKSHHLPPHPVDMPHQSPPSPVITRSQQGVPSSSVGKQVQPKFPPHTNGRKQQHQRSAPSVVTNQQLAPPTPPEDADMNQHQRAASKVGPKPRKQRAQVPKTNLVGYGAGTFGPYGLKGDSFKRHRGAGS